MPGYHGAKRVAGDLSDHYYQRNAGDRYDVLPQQNRVDQHPDCHEKHRCEKVAHRFHKRLDPATLRRLRHYCADEERPKCHAEPQLGRHERRAETQPQHGDEQAFVAFKPRHKIKQPRHHQKPDDQHGHEEHQQLASGD